MGTLRLTSNFPHGTISEIYEVVIESNCPGWVVFEVSVNHDSKGCRLDAVKVTAEE